MGKNAGYTASVTAGNFFAYISFMLTQESLFWYFLNCWPNTVAKACLCYQRKPHNTACAGELSNIIDTTKSSFPAPHFYSTYVLLLPSSQPANWLSICSQSVLIRDWQIWQQTNRLTLETYRQKVGSRIK